jgi:xylulokinase
MLCCGIDIGSTNVKVVLADGEGRSRWVKSVATPRRHDGIGIATDAGQMVALLEDLIIAGWRETGGGQPLAAIAAAGVGEDGVCAGDTLQPLGLVIPWFDKRALPEVAEFSANFSLTRNDFHTTAGKWMWLRQHRADEIGSARLWITLTDYAASLWCGEPFICETLAARTGCYDVFARAWNATALDFAKAPPLPRLLKAGDVAGTVKGGRLIASGAAGSATLVVAGGHDHPIASSAIQRIEPTARFDSIGTANAIYGETPARDPRLDGSNLEASVPALGGPGISLIGVTEFSATLLESFGGEAEVREHLKPSRLAGSPLPTGDDAAARLRRVLEQMALRARGYLGALDRAQVPRGRLYATGGWARSTALMELRASMFREPVTVVDEPELVGLGAALLAHDAATGARQPFTAADGLHVIDPLGRWAEAYAGL